MLHRKMIFSALISMVSAPLLAETSPLTEAATVANSTDTLLRQGTRAYRRGDYEVAASNFRKLAARDIASAETLLGIMSARGQGVPRNDAVAAAWFLRAAGRGYAPAQLALAHAFAQGRGVKIDKNRAVALARAAAAQDQPGAAQLVLREGPERTAMLGARP